MPIFLARIPNSTPHSVRCFFFCPMLLKLFIIKPFLMLKHVEIGLSKCSDKKREWHCTSEKQTGQFHKTEGVFVQHRVNYFLSRAADNTKCLARREKPIQYKTEAEVRVPLFTNFSKRIFPSASTQLN